MKLATKFGTYGGTFVPETLMPALEQLEDSFLEFSADINCMEQLSDYLKHYAGRPTPLYHAKNLSAQWGTEVYLKREDLLHGGAHKTNNAIGQALLAKFMGKERLIAETGAGQHGVACAMAGAMLGMPVEVYMGSLDVERQHQNVQRMELLGARVHRVEIGGRTLKDAINAALRDWVSNLDSTHYVLGTAAGPHPFPTLVKFFQSIIGKEAKEQFSQMTGAKPDAVVACVGGGSNAIGIFSAFVDTAGVELIGVEPGGRGLDSLEHGAVLQLGSDGCMHGMISKVLQDESGQIKDTHSIAAGLDYPSVGPEHAHLSSTGRAIYGVATDDEAVQAFQEVSRLEGIIPALESSHALAYVRKHAKGTLHGKRVLINVSGRGDKDLTRILEYVEQNRKDFQ
jgi:tryptophan synthase beta chain